MRHLATCALLVFLSCHHGAGHVHGAGYWAWAAAKQAAADAGVSEPDAGVITLAEAPPDVLDDGTLDAGSEADATSARDTPPRSPLQVDAKGLPRVRMTRVWSSRTPGTGTSSPQWADLDGDGVLDVVVCGWIPGQRSSTFALAGATGKLLWVQRQEADTYATPLLVDLDLDGTADVVIGGRNTDATAYVGKTGALLWSLRAANPGRELSPRSFNGAAPVVDQDGDGVTDLVLSQGGSLDDTERLPGHVYVVSGRTGRVLSDVASPDGREIYSMPAVVPGVTPVEVVVGSGGETLPGHLYRLVPSTGQVRWAVESKVKGFIASPVLADLDGRGAVDVVTTAFDGTVMRVDGATGALEWQAPRDAQEALPSPALGAFGGGEQLDVVASVAHGTFPDLHHNTLLWLDGRSGALLDQKRHGVYADSSPVVVDLDGDGFDEVIAVSMDSMKTWHHFVHSTVAVFDGHRGRAVRMTLQVRGAGSATPHVGDLDGDGKLDLVLAFSDRVDRYRIDVEGNPRWRVRWDGFRGPRHDGTLR